ncbi:MAG TPA: DUF6580 family putative transport protein [Flavisolibacter sp.]|jgi:hypothetical protein
MKLKSVLFAFALLIVVGSVFRLLGFAPQIAMAVFGGAMIADKKLAFALPLLSMFLSDVLYEVLYQQGYFAYGGFYEGQLANYILIAALTLVGFMVKGWNWGRIGLATLIAPTVFFLASNFAVWAGGGGYQHAKTYNGLMLCYADALPFYRSSLISTAVFSIILFGGYYLIERYVLQSRKPEAVSLKS